MSSERNQNKIADAKIACAFAFFFGVAFDRAGAETLAQVTSLVQLQLLVAINSGTTEVRLESCRYKCNVRLPSPPSLDHQNKKTLPLRARVFRVCPRTWLSLFRGGWRRWTTPRPSSWRRASSPASTSRTTSSEDGHVGHVLRCNECGNLPLLLPEVSV